MIRLAYGLFFLAFTLQVTSALAQDRSTLSGCKVEYQNHNQIDYGPLVIQHVSGSISDETGVVWPGVCVAIFTESEHRLVGTTTADEHGSFSLPDVAPGRYRLVIGVYPMCVPNVPLQVVKHSLQKTTLRIHLKAAGIDTCSYGDVSAK